MDSLVRAIEALHLHDTPLNTSAMATKIGTLPSAPVTPDPKLLGTWTLDYASNGHLNRTNLLASLLHVAETIPGMGLGKITQRLATNPDVPGSLLVENSTTISLGAMPSLV